MSDRDAGGQVVSITDAAPSLDDEQRVRRRHYSILMVVHIVGFAVAGLLYERAWWVGLVLIIATGALPWIAVVLANDSAVRRGPTLSSLGSGTPPGDQAPAPPAVVPRSGISPGPSSTGYGTGRPGEG